MPQQRAWAWKGTASLSDAAADTFALRKKQARVSSAALHHARWIGSAVEPWQWQPPHIAEPASMLDLPSIVPLQGADLAAGHTAVAQALLSRFELLARACTEARQAAALSETRRRSAEAAAARAEAAVREKFEREVEMTQALHAAQQRDEAAATRLADLEASLRSALAEVAASRREAAAAAASKAELARVRADAAEVQHRWESASARAGELEAQRDELEAQLAEARRSYSEAEAEADREAEARGAAERAVAALRADAEERAAASRALLEAAEQAALGEGGWRQRSPKPSTNRHLDGTVLRRRGRRSGRRRSARCRRPRRGAISRVSRRRRRRTCW